MDGWFGERIRLVLARVANFVRAFVSWVMATLLVCACVVGFYYFQRADEELRIYAERKLAACFPNHNVLVGSAHLVKGEGVRLQSVSIVQPARAGRGDREELVFCKDVVFACVPSLDELLSGHMQIDQVRLVGLTLRAKCLEGGTWNVPIPLEALPGGRPPTVLIEDAVVELVDERVTPPRAIRLESLQAELVPNAADGDMLAVSGSFGSDHVRRLVINEAYVDKRTFAWQIVQGHVDGLEFDQDLLRLLPFSDRTVPQLLRQLQLVAKLQFSAAQGSKEPFPRFRARGVVVDGRFESPQRLGSPITGISAESFELTWQPSESTWRIDNAAARYGTASVSISAQGTSLDPNGDLEIFGSATGLDLTHELIRLLPKKPQETWAKYQPLGLIDMPAFKLTRKAGQWWTGADVECRDVSILCSKFKYPFVRARGPVRFRQNQKLTAELWASASSSPGAPVHIVANIDRPGPDFFGSVQVKSHAWLRLDDQLTAALPPGVYRILRDMHAGGEVTFDATMTRSAEPGSRVLKDITVGIRNGALRHAKFPYPLQNVHGQVHVTENLWTFTDFSGQNDSCIVNAKGTWTPRQYAPDGRRIGDLDLDFVATDIPCDEELRNALPPGPKEIWRGLRPTGHIDYAKIDLLHQPGMLKPEIDVTIRQLPRQTDPHRHHLEIQPTWFPLPMNRVTGVVNYQHNGGFTLDEIKAEYGSEQRAAQLQSSGSGKFHRDGSWEVNLKRVITDDIETSPELLAALPAGLGDAMRGLRFGGNLSVDGRIQFLGGGKPHSAIQSSWSAAVNVVNGQFSIGNQDVTNVYGELRVTGQKRHGVSTNWGIADFNLMTWKGVPIKDVYSPWRMDQNLLIIGAGAKLSTREETPNHLSAHLFGGEAQADGVVSLAPDHAFRFTNVALAHFDVAEIAKDLGFRSDISGRGEARLTELIGSAEGLHTLKGKGYVRLRDANLARLPAVISLVNALRSRKTSPDAFTSSDIDFTINGPYFNLNQFDLHGDSLSLKGRGWIAMDRQLNIVFHTILGGEKGWLPSWRQFASRTSQQLLRILVTGTIDDMQMTPEVLPGLNDIFPEQVRQPVQRLRR